MTSAPLQDPGHTASLIYITCGSRDEATSIARKVVEERLAACAILSMGCDRYIGGKARCPRMKRRC